MLVKKDTGLNIHAGEEGYNNETCNPVSLGISSETLIFLWCAIVNAHKLITMITIRNYFLVMSYFVHC